MSTLIRHGRVALDGSLHTKDVRVAEGRVEALLEPGTGTAERIIDATGCYVLPGFMDFHTHVDDRIGPYYLADTYASATAVGVANGVTTLCTFVTQEPQERLAQALTRARAKAEGTSHADVLWHLTPTTFSDRDLTDLRVLVMGGYRTLKLYTTYKTAGIYASYERIDALFRDLNGLGPCFMVHCEDDATIEAVDVSTVDLSKASAHARLRPEAAEILAIQRVVDLAHAHGAALHVVHVSTLGGAQHLVDHRARVDLSFETCPQYLFLDEGWLAREDGHRWLCSPPLRGNRAPFVELIRKGAADMLATDHCPFCRAHKDAWDGRDYRAVPNGLPGLGALPHLAWKLWEDDADHAALQLATHLSLNPARRAGLADRKGAIRPGLDADLVILDPSGPERPVSSSSADTHESFSGFTTHLDMRHVLLRGEVVAEQGRLTRPERPLGRLLQPAPDTLPLT